MCPPATGMMPTSLAGAKSVHHTYDIFATVTGGDDWIGATPGDAALAVQTLEVTDQQHPEVNPRRNPRPAKPLGVVRPEQIFDELVEPRLGQQPVELLVKRMPRPTRQISRRNPKLRLPLSLPSSQRHRMKPPHSIRSP